jgi:hypothetical protein
MYVYTYIYILRIHSLCSLIFPNLHNTYIPWKRRISGKLSEFHKILKDIVKRQLQAQPRNFHTRIESVLLELLTA